MEVKWGFDFGNNQFFRCKIIEKKKCVSVQALKVHRNNRLNF